MEELLLRVDTNRPYLRDWLPWLEMTRTIDEMIMFVESALHQLSSNQGFQTAIWHHGQIIGIIGYHHLEWANSSTCIGYWLDEEHCREVASREGRAGGACHCRMPLDEWSTESC